MDKHARAEQIMRKSLGEQRTEPRTPVCLSGVVNCSRPGYREVLALVRDVSSSGLFFYANFSPERGTPEIGSEVELTFSYPTEDKRAEVLCRGTVVRIVTYPTGAATGVALQLIEQKTLPRTLEYIS
jgi:pyridoxine/pyridoxamine 5'-phosphate oxidase